MSNLFDEAEANCSEVYVIKDVATGKYLGNIENNHVWRYATELTVWHVLEKICGGKDNRDAFMVENYDEDNHYEIIDEDEIFARVNHYMTSNEQW
jgi:hypothetical protein